MFKNKISILSFIILSSSLFVACGRDEVAKEDAQVEQVEQIENTQTEGNKTPEVLAITKKTLKNSTELKSFSKSKIKEFENILKANKIDYVISEDDSLIINKNKTYEKYTKLFNQLAYTHISTDYENGQGQLKTGLKVNIHLEEQASTSSNNVINAMFDIVKLHNPNTVEEAFNEELKNATSNPSDISDKNITTGVDGLTIQVKSNIEANEREIILSIRQELELPKIESLKKEYKTVKDFKEDSEKLKVNISEKIEKTNDILKNSYLGKYKESYLKSGDLIIEDDSKYFMQYIDIEYTGVGINNLQDETLTCIYEIIESILTKDKLSTILTLNDFKSYVNSLKIYTGADIGGIPVDELGNFIEPNYLPFIDEVGISMSYEKSKAEESNNEESNSEESTQAQESQNVSTYDSYIKITVKIPVKAEGITRL